MNVTHVVISLQVAARTKGWLTIAECCPREPKRGHIQDKNERRLWTYFSIWWGSNLVNSPKTKIVEIYPFCGLINPDCILSEMTLKTPEVLIFSRVKATQLLWLDQKLAHHCSEVKRERTEPNCTIFDVHIYLNLFCQVLDLLVIHDPILADLSFSKEKCLFMAIFSRYLICTILLFSYEESNLTLLCPFLWLLQMFLPFFFI